MTTLNSGNTRKDIELVVANLPELSRRCVDCLLMSSLFAAMRVPDQC